MSLVTPWNGSISNGQSLIKVASASVVGLNEDGVGMAIFAPADSAALAMPVSAKQLCGSLMGLSVTITDAAPARRQSRATSATRSGCDVADSAAGEAKAALTFNTTRSPDLMNRSMPPSAERARLTVFTRSEPVTMLIFGAVEDGTEKSGSVADSPTMLPDGPLRSCSHRPTLPAATMAAPALAERTRKSRRASWLSWFTVFLSADDRPAAARSLQPMRHPARRGHPPPCCSPQRQFRCCP